MNLAGHSPTDLTPHLPAGQEDEKSLKEESHKTIDGEFGSDAVPSIFDDDRIYPGVQPNSNLASFDKNNPELIVRGTVKALVVQISSPEVIDYNLLCEFFLTYRLFSTSEDVMSLLLIRLSWSLGNIFNSKETRAETGRLIFLRLFVVFRHWILNYFMDDFESNFALADQFVDKINLICESNAFKSKSTIFEKKIITDLKIHWLTMLSHSGRMTLSKEEIKAAAARNLSKFSLFELQNINNSRKRETYISLHTNASYRRSVMLSLFDRQNNQKDEDFIEDDKENIQQQIIGNLSMNHKSNRNSIQVKLQQLKQVHRPSSSKVRKNQTPKTNHNIMTLQDSSLDLKKVFRRRTSINFPVKGQDPGFTVNGTLAIPHTTVGKIIPPTPVKKMEYEIKTDLGNSPIRRPSKRAVISPEELDITRRGSIKRIVESWKNSIIAPREIDENVRESWLAKTIDPSTYSGGTNPIQPQEENDRVDVLSARIVDELEHLIKTLDSSKLLNPDAQPTENVGSTGDACFSTGMKPSEMPDLVEATEVHTGIDLIGSSAGTKGLTQVDLQDLFQLEILKIDNLINCTDNLALERPPEDSVEMNNSTASFPKITSIDWNAPDGTSFERTEMSNVDNESRFIIHDVSYDAAKTKERLVKSETQYFDVDSDFEGENEKSSSMDSSNEFERYVAEVQGLGIKLEGGQLEQTPDISKANRLSLRSRSSTNSIFRRESIKSYISYDSILSNNVLGHLNRDVTLERNLRKKHGYNDLRVGNGTMNESFNDGRRQHGRSFSGNSFVSRSSSIKKSIRFSTFGALEDLMESSAQSGTRHRESSMQRNLSPTNLDDSSVFSIAVNSTRGSTREKGEVSESGNNSSDSVAIPGISNFALKELASIPDEEPTGKDVMKFTLRKLEGKNESSADSLEHHQTENSASFNTSQDLDDREEVPGVAFGENIPEEVHGTKSIKDIDENDMGLRHERNQSVSMAMENTQEILDEINNANTQDAIELDDFGDDSEVLPLSTKATHREKEYIHSAADVNFDVNEPMAENSEPKDLEPQYNHDQSSKHISSNHSIQQDQLVQETNGIESDSDKATEKALIKDNQLLVSSRQFEVNLEQDVDKMVLKSYYQSRPELKVEAVLDNRSHISFVLGVDSTTLAVNMTLIERDLLSEIDWKDLIELKWNKELTPVNGWLEVIVNENYYKENKGVNLVISRFNLMVNWIISEILLTTREVERIALISRFIHVAQNCLVLQNFSSLVQIILALSSEKVEKLKETWRKLPPGDILMLKNLEDICSPLRNFMSLRICLNRIIPSRGCVPFVGLYLSDLIFNAERPSHISSKVEIQDLEEIVNFSKFRTSVQIVKSLSQLIKWSKHYKVQADEAVLSRCLYIKSLDEDEMNICLEKLLEAQEV